MKSIWQATASLPTFPTLEGDTKTDVLIIGGGLAGILTAYYLRQRGIPYLLAEQGRICGGTTGNTTGKITLQQGLLYHKLIKTKGKEAAAMYLRAGQAACAEYERLAASVSCEYEVQDNFVYSRDNGRILEDEVEALQSLGCPALYYRDLPLPVETIGAVGVPEQAQFHPLRFVAGIAGGLNIRENTKVLEMEGLVAVTNRGRITAEKVIVTTHFPIINKHGLYPVKLYQHRSYVVALEGGPRLDGMYVDAEHSGFSFRNYGDFLLLGGGGHRTGQKTEGWAPLREMARLRYPNADAKYQWAAQDTMSLDGIPYIGHYSKKTAELYVACGFNKWGMIGAMMAAQSLSGRLAGTPAEYSEVFEPSRSMMSKQFFINAGEAVKNLATPTIPRCPHMGCALKWNRAEHSWDCPCHGSRFAEDGTLLNNPATGEIRQNRTE